MSKKRLVIIGAGGFGREACEMAPDCREPLEVKGFLDANPHALAAFDGYPPVLGSPETYSIAEEDVFFCALGNTRTRKRCVETLLQRGAKFANLVHKDADIGRRVKLGEGCFIRNHVTLTADIELGNHVSIFDHSFAGHDCRIADWCHLESGVILGGGDVLEEGVVIHPAASIVPRRRIGAWTTIGIGSVVLRNLPPSVTVFGNPATVIA